MNNWWQHEVLVMPNKKPNFSQRLNQLSIELRQARLRKVKDKKNANKFTQAVKRAQQ